MKINGIISIDILEEDLLKIKFNPEAITARQIAYAIEDKLCCKVRYHHENEGGKSLVDQQQEHMKLSLKEYRSSLVFTVPIFFLSMILTMFVGESTLADYTLISNLPIYNFILWFLATPVQFWFGGKFYRGAYNSLKQGSSNMEVLIVLGTSAAYFYGCAMNLLYMTGYHETISEYYIESTHSFETSSLLISIVLLGKYLESKSKHRTTDAITKLAGLQISHAVCIENGCEKETDVGLLEVGCTVKVYPGASVPVDGTVVEGEAWINESMMTGESSLVHKLEGDFVFGGTVCSKGTINVHVTKVGKDTALSQIIALVENAQSTKPPIQGFADKISGYFVPVVIFLSVLTWIIWFSLIYSGNQKVNDIIKKEGKSRFIFGFNFGISVLVIACPCALGLATPTAVMVATGVAARFGILIKGGDALEGSANIKTIVFDKTGTLTEGKPKVIKFKTFPGLYKDHDIQSFIQSVEVKSEHPIAKAITNYIGPHNLPCSNFYNIDGEGVSGVLTWRDEEITVHIGNYNMVKSKGIRISSKIKEKYLKYENQGKTVIIASINRTSVALIAVAESELVKPEAPWVISKLHEMGLEVWIITGDNKKSALKVASILKIPESRVLANCYPGDKKAIVEHLQGLNSKCKQTINKTILEETHFEEYSEVKNEFNGVMFVGDGINDSPSLAQADIGIAIGGTDIANDAAGVVLLKKDLKDVLITLDLSKKAVRKIKWNFFWAFFYNICGIPLAGGVIYIWTQVHITSIMAAAAMACSSTAVVLSSLLLNKYTPPH